MASDGFELHGGYDIDDTKLDFVGPFIEFSGQQLGRTLSYSDVSDYDVSKSFSVPRERAQELLNLFYAEQFSELLPVPGAFEALKHFSGFVRARDLTARPERHRQVTLDSIDRHFVSKGVPIEEIHFCYHHYEKCGNKRKHELATELGLDFMVEDSPQNAVELADHGTQVYLLRRPWNAGLNSRENLTVCENWEQVVELVDKLRKLKQGK